MIGIEKVSIFDKLILSIVERNNGEKLVSVTKRAGAKGGTIILGRGTAENDILRFLGIGDSGKDIVLTLTENDSLDTIINALITETANDKKMRGCSAVIGVNSVMKSVVENNAHTIKNIEAGGNEMNANVTHEMISIIVNSGFADDVMIAARKAGASGGTIINARGTGTEDDVKFFGIPIVPEKEILVIVAEKEKTTAIMEAVKNLACFSAPGSGICFCTDVEKFITLGPQK